MSNITDWINTELYPTLFYSIDRALPEFNFKQKGRNWVSTNKLKVTGETGDSIGKVYVWENAPGYIKDFTREPSSIIDYVKRRDGVEFIQAVRTLADVLSLQVPNSKNFNPETYQRQKDQATLLETCNSYFTYCLETSSNAKEVKDYLNSRGYSSDHIKAMELGYIPSQEKLFKELLRRGYSQELIDNTIKLNPGIGSTHSLSIPYRSGGSLKGFKFRTIGDTTPKYLNSTDLDRNGGFFNLSPLKGDKDVVIVEGELDSLHATIRGVDNVVATGGSSINPEQVKDAIRRGAKSFTICFDMEPDIEEETAKKINKAIEVILGEDVNRVYIVTLPDLGEGKTDPDRLIKEKGVESFKTAIAQAQAYYTYWINNISTKYYNLFKEAGELQPKEVDNLIGEIIETSGRITDPIDKDRYKKAFLSMDFTTHLGITEETINAVVNKITYNKAREDQAKEFKKLLSQAKDLQDKGETDKALELLDSKVKEVKLKDKATEFSSLMIPIKEDELKQRQANKPESLNSGYTIGGETLLLPSGAISILTAPTSHGKTTFLINMALNVAQSSPDTETYLFSYEEDGDSILINTLNTYLDEEISSNNRRTLKSYFTTGSTEYIKNDKRDYFTNTKDKFFRELIETRRLNIHYSSYNSDTIIEAIRYLHKHAKPGAIFIDYIQLLNLPEGKYKTYSRQEEIKEICIALKDVAVETGLPIILGAQFNREVINQLKLHATKIGEAGDIERIANLIVGFWNNNFKPLATEGELNEINSKGVAPDTLYTTILKNRGGRVGLEEILSFNGNTGKIKNSSSSGSSYFK